ncbi:MAG: YdcF family protein [Planctomycetes bacterium]|nr:YdcF family protein [Planctomycetota bacterium]
MNDYSVGSEQMIQNKKLKFLIIVFILSIGYIVASNGYIILSNWHRVYSSSEKIPIKNIGVVLGCAKRTHFFSCRVAGAVKLYREGKIKHILVSGDNHKKSYDEPTDMKKAMVAMGVPSENITCDYAGFRTLDTIVRAKEIFGADDITIISQRFHNFRALEVAKRHGIQAIAYCAENVPNKYKTKTDMREILARAYALIDLYILNKKPKFLGRFEPIKLSSRAKILEPKSGKGSSATLNQKTSHLSELSKGHSLSVF